MRSKSLASEAAARGTRKRARAMSENLLFHMNGVVFSINVVWFSTIIVLFIKKVQKIALLWYSSKVGLIIGIFIFRLFGFKTTGFFK